jgi:hypothetical protein
MKTLFNIQLKNGTGAFMQKNVQAADAGGKAAIVVAIEAALAATPGYTFQQANVVGEVLDATVAA